MRRPTYEVIGCQANLVRRPAQLLPHPCDLHPLHYDALEAQHITRLINTRKQVRRQEPGADKAREGLRFNHDLSEALRSA